MVHKLLMVRAAPYGLSGGLHLSRLVKVETFKSAFYLSAPVCQEGIKPLKEELIRGGIAAVIPQQRPFDCRDKATNNLLVRESANEREKKEQPERNGTGARHASLIARTSVRPSVHPSRAESR